MIELTIDNSECKITGLSVSQFRELREMLSYDSSSYQSYKKPYTRLMKSFLISQKGVFPTGLLGHVDQYLLDNKIENTVRDLRVVPKRLEKPIELYLGLQPYVEQIEASKACLANSRGTVSACTGFGKSITMALVIQLLNVKTLIVVPNLTLKKQLTDSFLQYFGNLDNITIENIDSKSLKTHTNFDCLIIDEAHHVAAKTYRKLSKTAWKNIYYRFFFTATPFRSKDEEQLLFESIAGQVIYRVDYQTAVDKSYIVPIEAFYIEIPKIQIKGNEKSWPSMYSELVVNNEIRNDIISNLLKNLYYADKSALCLVKEINHGKNLEDELTNGFFAHGENESTSWLIQIFNERRLKILLGTSGVLGEGIDTKPAEWIIIAGLGKSKNQFMQQIGRGVRKSSNKTSCKVLIFLDKSHKWTKAHFKEQCKILLDEYGIIPLKLDI